MLKLNVGFSRKLGEANYGSRGASINVEVEVDSGLIGDADRLKDRIRQLFALAKGSVDEELAGKSHNGNGANGKTSDNGNGRRRDGTRRATASQIRAIHAIVDRQRLDLTAVLHERYGINDPTELSITEASELIDSIKNAGNGTGGKR
ncbi:MAG: hypothetical protein C0483_07555 [Pirellula sp.]|nr:hypothetical protein [Pirellula sp.]